MLIAKPQATRQQGFAMLEVMLAVLIIAIASFGIYKLYSSASDNSKLSQLEGTISQINQGMTKYASVFYKRPDSLTPLVSAGYIPADVTDSAGTVVNAPYPTTFKAGANGGYDSFELDITGIPESTALQFARDMLGIADVSVNNTAYDGTTDPTIQGTNAFKLNFPKGTAKSD